MVRQTGLYDCGLKFWERTQRILSIQAAVTGMYTIQVETDRWPKPYADHAQIFTETLDSGNSL